MSWIPKKAPEKAPAATARTAQLTVPVGSSISPRSTAISLEMPVVMSVRRLPAPVYGTLMDINAHGARVRSLVLMERGTEVEFDLTFGNGSPIAIYGRVEGRRNAASGARFEYHLSFDAMAEAHIDMLVRAVREIERRAAASRSIQKSIDELPTTDRDRRGSYRALTAFSALYRRESDQWSEARIADISATGVRMNCEELIAIGTMLDVRLTLPSIVLGVYPEQTTDIDMTQSGPRRSGRADLQRPFEEMALRGRVVTRFQPVRERECYGIAFIEIDGYQREEIARYTHAIQLSKIRTR